MARVTVNNPNSGQRAHSNYGTHKAETQAPSKYQRHENQIEYHYRFAYDNLPAAKENDSLILTIPANARLISATLRVITAFAGGTSYNIGLQQADGTEIDNDGIDAAVLLAAIDTVGETVVCDGALVGNTAGIGANAGQVVVAATGTFTAGEASLVLTFEELEDRASFNA